MCSCIALASSSCRRRCSRRIRRESEDRSASSSGRTSSSRCDTVACCRNTRLHPRRTSRHTASAVQPPRRFQRRTLSTLHPDPPAAACILPRRASPASSILKRLFSLSCPHISAEFSTFPHALINKEKQNLLIRRNRVVDRCSDYPCDATWEMPEFAASLCRKARVRTVCVLSTSTAWSVDNLWKYDGVVGSSPHPLWTKLSTVIHIWRRVIHIWRRVIHISSTSLPQTCGSEMRR